MPEYEQTYERMLTDFTGMESPVGSVRVEWGAPDCAYQAVERWVEESGRVFAVGDGASAYFVVGYVVVCLFFCFPLPSCSYFRFFDRPGFWGSEGEGKGTGRERRKEEERMVADELR